MRRSLACASRVSFAPITPSAFRSRRIDQPETAPSVASMRPSRFVSSGAIALKPSRKIVRWVLASVTVSQVPVADSTGLGSPSRNLGACRIRNLRVFIDFIRIPIRRARPPLGVQLHCFDCPNAETPHTGSDTCRKTTGLLPGQRLSCRQRCGELTVAESISGPFCEKDLHVRYELGKTHACYSNAPPEAGNLTPYLPAPVSAVT